jgi:molybdate transport system substrate-binding protein
VNDNGRNPEARAGPVEGRSRTTALQHAPCPALCSWRLRFRVWGVIDLAKVSHRAAGIQNQFMKSPRLPAWRTLARRACLVTALLLAPLTNAAEVMVFGAASLSESLREIGALYEKESGDRILFNLGASSLLARQIQEGAGADIFFSADDAKMDALAAKDLIEPGTRKDRLGNALVIVVFRESELRPGSARDLARVRRIAIGEPSSVPAGIYAREYLVKRGLWGELERKVVPTENVRAALAAVESGNVDAGIVYRTDAAISRKVRVAFEVPIEEGPGINYPVAMLRGSKRKEAARRFLEFVNGKVAAEVFRKRGFIVHE